MAKPTPPQTKLEWAGIDLHVHSPASRDYIGPKEDSEYIGIIKRANDFEDLDRGFKSGRPRATLKPIKCIAFTDHNSVEGFRKWKGIYDDTIKLAEAVRDRDPNNPLVQKLDEDIAILRSVRVLMGFELKAYPGVHLLFIFHESVDSTSATQFLSDMYQQPYEAIAGDPEPTTVVPVEEILSRAIDLFHDHFLVVAPHVESHGGVYEALKQLNQVRIRVLTHPALRALSFNKSDTRDRLKEMLSKPEYARAEPLSFIQASDAHGSRGVVGQPRTDVKVPNGRATFTSIKEALSHSGRIKCSVDFADEEYNRLINDEPVALFQGQSELPTFRQEDRDEIASFACAALNGDGGIIVLDATLPPGTELHQIYPEQLRKELDGILEGSIEPEVPMILTRAISFSANKVRVLFKFVPTTRLYAKSGTVLILDGSSPRNARAYEIETVVARRMQKRFGPRFQRTLERVSEDSILLSKMPRGIPIFIRCRERMSFLSSKDLGKERLDGVSSKGRETSEEAEHLHHTIIDSCPFGVAKGNATILWHKGATRELTHYTRFLGLRADVPDETGKRCASTNLASDAIVVTSGGAAHLCEPGPLITEFPAVRISFPHEWLDHRLACLAWLKSSYFVWYCAVHLSNRNLYQHLLQGSVLLPFPKLSHGEFYGRLGLLAQNIVLEERKFLGEIQHEMKRGCDAHLREKLRSRHNASVNSICLSIDREISDLLSLTENENEFIARTLGDIDLTDFGYLEELEARRKSQEDV